MDERASDLHVEPTGKGYEIRFRVDGVLGPGEHLDAMVGRAVVARLMVMARLLTYRLDVPQEGRLTLGTGSAPSGNSDAVEFRLSVMPTIHGLRAAIRVPADHVKPAVLDALGLPELVLAGLTRFARADSGMLIVTGPAGSGKTTLLYALLRHIQQISPGVSIITLEDPVERKLPGVTQIEVSPFGQLSYEKALRSLLRQDPQVLMLGEIRDAATASLAVQAALSGHRLMTTLHASTPGGAMARLLEMGIEPYQLTSSIFAIVSQRLVRRRALSAKKGCGRLPVAEFVEMDSELRKAVLVRADGDAMKQIYRNQKGYESLEAVAERLAEQGLVQADGIVLK
jgi:type II secretory ATPase GspE/PulE/Tfp pilus assembly ATPase PilB-like protein